MPTTVFWPADVKHSGFCYGWTAPAICVVGVLKAGSEREANLALRTLHRSRQWKQHECSCGGELSVIGKYEVDEDKAVQKLNLFHPLDYCVIYYTRNESRTLRFYSLRLDSPNVPDGSAYLTSFERDFTAPKRSRDTATLTDTIINQFNAARTLDSVIQSSGQKDDIFTSVLISATIFEGLSAIFHLSYFPPKFCAVPLLLFFALKDVLATFQQIDVRAEQMEFFVSEVGGLRQRTSISIEQYSARYTHFFNGVWLILNDLIMGIALGTFICENYTILSTILYRAAENSLVNWAQWVLHWLDSWPAGLKLNTELSRFYSHSFVGVVTTWGDLLSRVRPHLPTIIYVVGIGSYGGITFTISLVLDLLAFLTFHIFICYAISSAVYRRMLKTFGSLWNLFRGKRYNVLRNRTDSWQYDLDQLVFGTILFTLLAFIFPTVLVYYALFAVMRFCTLVIQASLETLLALVNHFPLFSLVLRIKDPWRLPGGVYFTRVQVHGSVDALEIKNQPVPLSFIFFQYIQLLSRLALHYNPLRLLYCVLSGDYLAAIPPYSIRYGNTHRRMDG